MVWIPVLGLYWVSGINLELVIISPSSNEELINKITGKKLPVRATTEGLAAVTLTIFLSVGKLTFSGA